MGGPTESWLAKVRTAPQPAPAPNPRGGGDPPRGFENAVIHAELDKVRRATEGARNDTLYKAAFNLAQVLPEDAWRPALADTAAIAGLDPVEITRTIDSGIKGAARNPRPAHRMPGNAPTRPVEHLPALDQYVDPTSNTPIDLRALWDVEAKQEWILEPLIAPGRQTVIYSAPKVGKSLLALQLVVAISKGRPALGVPTTQTKVLYLDYENDPVHDIRARLIEMNEGPDAFDNIAYVSYPDLPPLDTPAGAATLAGLIEIHDPGIVVIDTIGRATCGEENSNDTWQNLYRHTGLMLKRKGVALLRLDHTGKDADRGMRGGSAKLGDVDLVWHMTEVVRDEAYRLTCEAKRMYVPEETIDLRREHDPLAHHPTTERAGAALERAVLRALEGQPADTGREVARRIVNAAGIKVRNGTLAEIIKRRRGAIDDWN